jgi:hypothetical protein
VWSFGRRTTWGQGACPASQAQVLCSCTVQNRRKNSTSGWLPGRSTRGSSAWPAHRRTDGSTDSISGSPSGVGGAGKQFPYSPFLRLSAWHSSRRCWVGRSPCAGVPLHGVRHELWPRHWSLGFRLLRNADRDDRRPWWTSCWLLQPTSHCCQQLHHGPLDPSLQEGHPSSFFGP